MSIVITTEIWYKRVPDSNKAKYDHSRAVYTRGKDKVEIICPDHGTFWQQADLHAKGAGCPKCADENGGSSQRTTQKDFIKKSMLVDGDEYDPELVVYKNSDTKVDLVCHKEGHGIFSLTPRNRLKGQGCPKCGIASRVQNSIKTDEKFKTECAELPERGLTYNKAVYKGDKVKVTITCKEHGDFDMWPSNHLQGQGCPKCAKYGYNSDKPGYLYILGTDKTKDIAKVGITNRTPTTRAKEITKSSGEKFHVLFHYYSIEGRHPQLLEKVAHEWLDKNYISTGAVFDGSTECYDKVNYMELITYMLNHKSATYTEVA